MSENCLFAERVPLGPQYKEHKSRKSTKLEHLTMLQSEHDENSFLKLVLPYITEHIIMVIHGPSRQLCMHTDAPSAHRKGKSNLMAEPDIPQSAAGLQELDREKISILPEPYERSLFT